MKKTPPDITPARNLHTTPLTPATAPLDTLDVSTTWCGGQWLRRVCGLSGKHRHGATDTIISVPTTSAHGGAGVTKLRLHVTATTATAEVTIQQQKVSRYTTEELHIQAPLAIHLGPRVYSRVT